MKKLVKSIFPLALVAVVALGAMTLLSEPAEARFHSTCPLGYCPNLNGWTFDGCCTIYNPALSTLEICARYKYTSPSGFTSFCYRDCLDV
ncbi:MAG: hypothetical protein AAF604_12765 [Acidobacteriota bacterium]